MCLMWWPLTLTYIFKVIRPWLWKSCPLCNVGIQYDSIVWVIMRRRGVSLERRRSSCSSLSMFFGVLHSHMGSCMAAVPVFGQICWYYKITQELMESVWSQSMFKCMYNIYIYIMKLENMQIVTDLSCLSFRSCLSPKMAAKSLGTAAARLSTIPLTWDMQGRTASMHYIPQNMCTCVLCFLGFWIYGLVSARLQYLQCVSSGDSAVLH